MFMEERHAKILELLNANGKVLVKELAEMFDVTEDSIRKDLGALEMDGKLKRTYGGAVSITEKLQVTKANRRRISDVDAKRKIAAAAVKLITPDDLVFIDISTISIAIAEILEKRDKPCHIITNMIDVLVMLSRNPKIEIIFAGGQLNKSRDGFRDSLNTEFMSNFRPDVAFIGVTGINFKKNSLSTNDINGGLHKSKIISVSKNPYIVAESRKIGIEAHYTFATLKDIRGVVTEAELSDDILQAVRDLNVEIVFAE